MKNIPLAGLLDGIVSSGLKQRETSKFVELISPANMLLDTKVLYLTLKKAFFQDTKGHNSVINRWCTMTFGVHHPLIHIYTHTKFQ